MSVTERERHELYLAMEEVIGTERADTMMAMLPPVGWADVATKQDLAHLQVATKQDLGVLRHDFDGLRQEFERVRQDFEGLRHDVRSDLEQLEMRMTDRFGAKLHEALHAQLRAFVLAVFTIMTLNIAAMGLFVS